ncbi:hypothetical protein L1049_017433 [Liquidambar formosana]|uniref:DOMON domain-containing protein n=1 Tax=Liquidambar formosana TaxID=63359 RepID=A0AAP0S7G6_LIQFO
MALLLSLLVVLGFSSLLLQIHTSQALTCTSQKFTKNRLYNHCSDLPHLRSYLHWTYDPSKSSLNLAFIAPPAKPSGWVAWAINPKRAGMVGAQALIAFQKGDGSMTVKTFDLVSYKLINQTKIAFDVSSVEGEHEDGVMRIFVTGGFAGEYDDGESGVAGWERCGERDDACYACPPGGKFEVQGHA